MTPGDIVISDAEQIVMARASSSRPVHAQRVVVEAVEAEYSATSRRGDSLVDMTNLRDHVAKLQAGEDSSLAIIPPR